MPDAGRRDVVQDLPGISRSRIVLSAAIITDGGGMSVH